MLSAGIDEAGRGPLAGPVFAAAVILDPGKRIKGLRDSKVLLPERREALAVQIRAKCHRVGGRVRRRAGDRHAQHPAGDAARDAPRGRGALGAADRGDRRRQPVPDARVPGVRDREGRPRRRVDLRGVDPRQDRARRAPDRSSTRSIRTTASRRTRATARRSTSQRSTATVRARSTAARLRRWRRCRCRSSVRP